MNDSTNADSANDEVYLHLGRKKSAYVMRRAVEYDVSVVKVESVKILGISFGKHVTLKGDAKSINALVLNAHYI